MKYINPFKLFTGSFIPEWLEVRPDISVGAKLIYARLCRYAGKDGFAYPGIDAIAEAVGMNDRSVKRYTKELRDNNLIEVEQRGLGRSNVYRFLNPFDDKLCPTGRDKIVPSEVSDVVPKEDKIVPPEGIKSSLPYKENHSKRITLRESERKTRAKELDGKDSSLKTQDMEDAPGGGDFTQYRTKCLSYFQKISGRAVFPGGGKAGMHLHELFKQGITEEQVRAVVDKKDKEFNAGTLKNEYYDPVVIFKPENFYRDLNALNKAAPKKERLLDKDYSHIKGW